jgi:hypothetical protein
MLQYGHDLSLPELALQMTNTLFSRVAILITRQLNKIESNMIAKKNERSIDSNPTDAIFFAHVYFLPS